ncbi:hypothetical protein KY340_03135 [Candidatus Woesearchaeota archaeon]|nr:hypothetical protein [Candidatus Woesearchaeota archaeon]
MSASIIMPKHSLEQLKVMNPKRTIKTFLVPAAMLQAEFNGKEFNILIELVKGHIVFKPEENYLVKLINLNDINMNEALVLRKALETDVFDLDQLDVGLGEIKTRNVIDNLCKKGMLIYIDRKYSVSDEVNFIYNPDEYASTEKILDNERTEQIFKDENSRKLPEKVNLDEIRRQISNICSVKNIKKCWILHYYIEK